MIKHDSRRLRWCFDVVNVESDIHSRKRNPSMKPGFDLVAGTVFGTYAYKIPIITIH